MFLSLSCVEELYIAAVTVDISILLEQVKALCIFNTIPVFSNLTKSICQTYSNTVANCLITFIHQIYPIYLNAGILFIQIYIYFKFCISRRHHIFLYCYPAGLHL